MKSPSLKGKILVVNGVGIAQRTHSRFPSSWPGFDSLCSQSFFSEKMLEIILGNLMSMTAGGLLRQCTVLEGLIVMRTHAALVGVTLRKIF